MSRRDGVFPPYVKLDLDKEVWQPKLPDYYDQSRCCNNCGTGWPNLDYFRMSPCCNDITTIVPGGPDMRWPDAVDALQKFRFEKYYDKYNDGLSDEELAFEEVKKNEPFFAEQPLN